MNIIHVQTDGSAQTTGRLMYHMVETYWRDMVPYTDRTLTEVFDRIKNIPFRPDPEFAETLQRPMYTMLGNGYGGDCDDKSIALASYCRAVGIPFRFVAVRRRDMPVLHHVYCMLYIRGIWIPADATYNFNALGRERETYAEYVTL